jgi:dTDP-glucose 4,6-dehydratase
MIDTLLEKECQVIGISRSKEINDVFLPYKWKIKENTRYSFYALDLNHQLEEIKALIKNEKPEFVINFAAQGMVAQSWLSPEDWYQTNVVSQVKLHDFLRTCDFISKYIHVSTPEVYGSTNKWKKETFDFNPSSPYAVSRAACDMHLKSFSLAYDFPVIFTRAANVYGPGQQLYRIIPRMMMCSELKEKLNLQGGGLSKRSFVYISDVTDATFKICMKGEKGKTYHISTNKQISIINLVKLFCLNFNVNFEKLVQISDPRLGHDDAYMLDSDFIRKSLNWGDKVNIEYGLEKTMKWVKDNITILKKLPQIYEHKK